MWHDEEIRSDQIDMMCWKLRSSSKSDRRANVTHWRNMICAGGQSGQGKRQVKGKWREGGGWRALLASFFLFLPRGGPAKIPPTRPARISYLSL